MAEGEQSETLIDTSQYSENKLIDRSSLVTELPQTDGSGFEQGVQALLASLPGALSLPMDQKYVIAFAKVFIGSDSFDQIEEGDVENVLKTIEEKIVKLCLLISGLASGIPLPEGFPDEVKINNLMND